jgi:hypothetical protein
MEARNSIWNIFHYCNFLQISTNFELIKRFRVKTGLTDLCSYRLIATLFSTRPKHLFGQGVLHGDLQSLYYQLVDKNKLCPNIQEVMELQIWLNIKQILKNSEV